MTGRGVCLQLSKKWGVSFEPCMCRFIQLSSEGSGGAAAYCTARALTIVVLMAAASVNDAIDPLMDLDLDINLGLRD